MPEGPGLKPTRYYLAYGSNLFGPRLEARAPSARAVARVALDGWELRFHKRGWRDGSAKCDIVRLAGATVHGAVYELAARDRPALDAAEGLGDGYRELATSLSVDGAVLPVFTYVAEPSHVDPSLAPFRWYRDLVVAGAREHALPPDYVERLTRVAAIPDPDRSRAARERSVLSPPSLTDRARQR